MAKEAVHNLLCLLLLNSIDAHLMHAFASRTYVLLIVKRVSKPLCVKYACVGLTDFFRFQKTGLQA